MNRRRFVLTTTTAAVVALAFAACGEKNAVDAAAATPPPAAAKMAPREVYEAASHASGFAVGPMMAANTVYVFFDPSCPHCAALWMNAKALAARLKVVWIPIGFLQRSSAPQGATILAAPDPAVAMSENEASVLERKGGITVSATLPDAVLDKVKTNTDLFRKFGEDSVPLIVFRNGRTGEFGTHAGAVSTEELAAMAGLTA